MLRLSPSPVVLRAGGLGLAQLVAWGALYYAIALLAEPMAAELGVGAPVVYGLFSGSLVLSALLAPNVGRLLDRRGGRSVMLASGAWGAAGFALLALAPSLPVLAVGFALNGVAMAFGLYDTCFAAVAQIESSSYRSTVTGITLLGGLASSVFWPLTHALLDRIEWRGTCAVFAVLLLACSVPYARLLPARAPVRESLPAREAGAAVEPGAPWRARWLAVAFASAAFVGGASSAHLVSVLVTLQFDPSSAVWIAASVGVLQVLGRLAELLAGGRIPSLRLGLIVFTAQLAGLACLLASGLEAWLVLPFVVLYGSANGLLTLVRAIVPREIVGTQRVGAVLGAFAAPSLLARAVAPAAFAVLTSSTDTLTALGTLSGVSLAALVAFQIAVRERDGTHPAGGGRVLPSRRWRTWGSC